MQKKITTEEFEHLMVFTRQHFVEHYDLQAELADHLANGIEQQWLVNPKLDFKAALQAEFKKFGIFGFSDVVAQRSKALSKKYYRLLWGYFCRFFYFPVVLGSLSAVVAIRFLLQLSHIIFPLVVVLLVVIASVRLFRIRKKYNDKVTLTGRRWLLEDIIYSCGGFSVMMNVPAQLYIHTGTSPSGNMLWVLSAVIVLLALYDYVVLWIIPARAEQHLEQVYPEYKLV